MDLPRGIHTPHHHSEQVSESGFRLVPDQPEYFAALASFLEKRGRGLRALQWGTLRECRFEGDQATIEHVTRGVEGAGISEFRFSKLGERWFLEDLLEPPEESRPRHRAEIEALVARGPASIPRLVELARDADDSYRGAVAAEGLVDLGPRGIPYLAELFRTHAWLAETVAGAMCRIGPGHEASIEALVAELGPAPFARLAADGLVRIGAPAIPALERARQRWHVAEEAAYVLQRIRARPTRR